MQNLQFDPVNLTEPFYQISPTQPPVIPQLQLAEPWMMEWVSWTSGLVALEVQNSAQVNSLRTYLFNQLACNAWQNQDFASLVKFVIEFTGMMLSQNRYPSPEAGIQTAVPYCVALVIADNVRAWPDLQAYITQEQYRDVCDSIAEFDAIQRDLQHYRGGFHRQQGASRPYDPRIQSDPRAGQQQHRPIYQGGGVAMQAGGAQSTVFANRVRPQAPLGNPARPNLPSKPSVYSRFARQNQQAIESPQGQGDISLQPPFKSRTEVMPPVNEAVEQQQEADGSILVKETESTYTWVPSEQQPYRPMYHPMTEERYHRVLSDGTVLVEVHPRDPIDMEFEKHQLPTFGNKREGFAYDPVRALEKLTRASTAVDAAAGLISQASKLTDDDQSNEANDIRARLAKGTEFAVIEQFPQVDVSERVLWTTANLKRLIRAGESDQPLDLHRTFAYLAEPIICAQDHTDFIHRLGESRTYVELAEKLNNATSGEVELRVLETINKRLLQMINRVIALYLSIPGGEPRVTDSFDAESIRELEAYLLENYGPVVQTAFKTHQRKHIQSVFFDLAKQPRIRQELSDALLGDTQFKDDKKPHLMYLTSLYSLTFLDLYAAELDIDFDADTSSLIEKGNSKALHHIAQSLFEATVENGPYYRHLLQTNDGEILEIVKGDIGQDAYLITKNREPWLE